MRLRTIAMLAALAILAGCAARPMVVYPPVAGYPAPAPGMIYDDPFEVAHDTLGVIDHGISTFGRYETVKMMRDWRKGRLDSRRGYYSVSW